MGYTYGFVDNASYTAADVNNVIKKLVTSGIQDPFTGGTAYNATKLNDIIYAVSSAGVVPSTVLTCKCSINTTEKTVTIAEGTAFFADGSTITIDNEGVTLPYTENAVNYVYLKASPPENKNYPVCSTTAPSGDYVRLAEITAAGVLTDKRIYARGKLPGYQSNIDTVMHISDTITLQGIPRPDFGDYVGNYRPATYTIHLGESNNYTKLLYVDDRTYGIYDIANETVNGVWHAGSSNYSVMPEDKIRLNVSHGYNANCTVAFAKSGTDLILTISLSASDGYATASVGFDFTIF